MCESYQKYIGKKSQRQVIETQFGDNEKKNFDVLWNSVNKEFHKFGRYTTWFYLQHLKHTAGIKIESTSLMLSDYSGSRSHRNGLCFALNKKEWIDTKLTPKEYDWLESQSEEILIEMKNRFPELSEQFDHFTLETCLCSFKKIFREKSSRYLGFYLDRQAEEIMQVASDNWNGIEWNVLWQARNKTIGNKLDKGIGIDNNKVCEYIKTKSNDMMNWMFEGMETPSNGLERCFA